MNREPMGTLNCLHSCGVRYLAAAGGADFEVGSAGAANDGFGADARALGSKMPSGCEPAVLDLQLLPIGRPY